MVPGVGADLLAACDPCAQLGRIHQRLGWHALGSIPGIGATQLPAHHVAGCREPVTLQRRQCMFQIVHVAIVQGDAHHLANRFTFQVRQQRRHAQATVPHQAQQTHLAGKGAGRDDQAAVGSAPRRRCLHLVVSQDGYRGTHHSNTMSYCS